MRTLKLTISYDGTRFVGWQRQAEGVSIQGLLEEALARFEGAPIAVHGAGRTDAGVHALGQVASVRLTSAHPTHVVVRGLNACLPQDVRVIGVQEASANFHARFSARSKTYRYLLHNAPTSSPFDRAFVWHVPESLDLNEHADCGRCAGRDARFRCVPKRGKRYDGDRSHDHAVGAGRRYGLRLG